MTLADLKRLAGYHHRDHDSVGVIARALLAGIKEAERLRDDAGYSSGYHCAANTILARMASADDGATDG